MLSINNFFSYRLKLLFDFTLRMVMAACELGLCGRKDVKCSDRVFFR
ncbi:hypothetical protein FDUTEX481_06250 [Tolypothrix sp. PCC 7601]|nr:hypothetical protein FDUTEX481_06250 [Tolypothrix sp. PCC 7601]